jgi:hypothetical protein
MINDVTSQLISALDLIAGYDLPGPAQTYIAAFG